MHRNRSNRFQKKNQLSVLRAAIKESKWWSDRDRFVLNNLWSATLPMNHRRLPALEHPVRARCKWWAIIFHRVRFVVRTRKWSICVIYWRMIYFTLDALRRACRWVCLRACQRACRVDTGEVNVSQCIYVWWRINTIDVFRRQSSQTKWVGSSESHLTWEVSSVSLLSW